MGENNSTQINKYKDNELRRPSIYEKSGWDNNQQDQDVLNSDGVIGEYRDVINGADEATDGHNPVNHRPSTNDNRWIDICGIGLILIVLIYIVINFNTVTDKIFWFLLPGISNLFLLVVILLLLLFVSLYLFRYFSRYRWRRTWWWR